MGPPRFLTICLNPVLQKTLTLGTLQPGAVNRLAAHRFDASGKGVNVTRVLRQLGEQAVHLTQLGGRLRDQFLALTQQEGLIVEWRDSGSEIRFCYTVLEEELGRTTELVEEAEPVSAECEAALDDAFAAEVHRADWITISGSKAEGLSGRVFPRWVAAAKAAGKRVVLDVRGADLLDSLRYEPDVVKPNEHEFVATFFGAQARPEVAAIREKMAEIAARYGALVVVTRGALDTWVATRSEQWCSPVTKAIPVNTTGSGDAFAAGLAAALARGATPREAIAEGHRCGALNAHQRRPGAIL